MRRGILWLAAVLLPLICAACADLPTAPIAAPGAEALADCYWRHDGSVYCDPVSPDWECDPWESLDWCNDDGTCMTSDPSQPSDPDATEATVQGCPGDGGGIGDPGGGTTPPPPGDDPGDPGTTCPVSDTAECPPEDEEYSDICPQPILGKVATALVPIAGRNHEFKFEGPFWRVNPLVGRSPAWYKIPRPTLSKDDWWMAESGSIQLVCWGRYVIVLGTRTWVGTMYVQSTDLHVVMGPGHPDF